MKLQKPRTLVMVIGLGTTLLLVGPVRAESARQPSAPGVHSGTPVARETLVANAGSKFEAKTISSQDANPLSAVEINEAVEEEAAPAGFPMEARLLMLLLVVGTGSIFLYERLVASGPTFNVVSRAKSSNV